MRTSVDAVTSTFSTLMRDKYDERKVSYSADELLNDLEVADGG